MNFKFTKMQGLGNDFVVIDGTINKVSLSQQQIKHVANRHFGIGADHLLILESTSQPDIDFFYRLYNADGSPAYFSGNGVRCLAQYVFTKKLIQKTELTFSSGVRITKTSLKKSGAVTVDVGQPIFTPSLIPFLTDTELPVYQLQYYDHKIFFGAVSLGNPHVVIKVESCHTSDINKLGNFFAKHVLFPESTNVNFVQIVQRNHIKLRTYERGSGETLACGSGACAAVAVGQLWQLLDETVTVEMAGGCLQISWIGPGANLFLSGPALIVFEGEYQLPLHQSDISS